MSMTKEKPFSIFFFLLFGLSPFSFSSFFFLLLFLLFSLFTSFSFSPFFPSSFCRRTQFCRLCLRTGRCHTPDTPTLLTSDLTVLFVFHSPDYFHYVHLAMEKPAPNTPIIFKYQCPPESILN